MVIFHSYVKLPEGNDDIILPWSGWLKGVDVHIQSDTYLQNTFMKLGYFLWVIIPEVSRADQPIRKHQTEPCPRSLLDRMGWDRKGWAPGVRD